MNYRLVVNGENKILFQASSWCNNNKTSDGGYNINRNTRLSKHTPPPNQTKKKTQGKLQKTPNQQNTPPPTEIAAFQDF